jgi:hypothetical protein
MIKATVDVFSGRENPSWIVDEKLSKDILKEISHNRGIITEINSGFNGLGFRGIKIELLSDELEESYNIPSFFKIANGASLNDSKGFDIAEKIINSMPKSEDLNSSLQYDIQFEDDIKKFLLDELETFINKGSTSIDTKLTDGLVETKIDAISCPISLGKFNPDFWNKDPIIKNNNNCYNYACNRKTNTFAQPGKYSGYKYQKILCPDVMSAALSDGLHKQFDCYLQSEQPIWLVALVINPGRDFHWYRKQQEVFWGHKPGGTEAKNTDNSGNIILNPETCNRGGYINFCGYMYVGKSVVIK